jgi:uncharacterized protein YjeT (DUF2065 family)
MASFRLAYSPLVSLSNSSRNSLGTWMRILLSLLLVLTSLRHRGLPRDLRRVMAFLKGPDGVLRQVGWVPLLSMAELFWLPSLGLRLTYSLFWSCWPPREYRVIVISLIYFLADSSCSKVLHFLRTDLIQKRASIAPIIYSFMYTHHDLQEPSKPNLSPLIR